MKVLVLAHRVPFPPNKGEKIRTFNQIKFLTKHECKVVVATPLENSEELSFANTLEQTHGIGLLHAQLKPKLYRLASGLFKGTSLSVSNFYNQALENQIQDYIEAEAPEVILCTSSAMANYVFSLPVFRAIKRTNIRLVMDFMDLDSQKWQEYADVKLWPMSAVYAREARLMAALEEQVLKNFDASIFVSDEEKQLIEKNSATTHVVANGVDLEKFYPAIKNTRRISDRAAADMPSNNITANATANTRSYNNAPVFLFSGVMDSFPNEQAVEWFVKNIWPQVKARHPGAEFIIAGMNPGKKTRLLKKDVGITVTGFVEDMLPYYHRADVFVAPFQIARGLQNKILQAMACELPVIATSKGATGISATPGHHLLVADKPNDFIDSIDRLLADKVLYQNLQAAGMQLIKQTFSWQAQNAVLSSILFESHFQNADQNSGNSTGVTDIGNYETQSANNDNSTRSSTAKSSPLLNE